MEANKTTDQTILLTCVPGLEDLLQQELKEFDVPAPTNVSHGLLSWTHLDWPDVAQIAVHSRLGSRLLMQLKTFSAKNESMLYDQIRRLPWDKIILPNETLLIHSHGSREDITYPLNFATLKIKDAICDEIKKLGQDRPNISKENPDVSLEAFFYRGKCSLSIDLLGEPLHRRGYRTTSGEAPLRENRAAALLRLAGYTGQTDFYDAFCGSGTITIEAALIATNCAPGILIEPMLKKTKIKYPELYKEIEQRLLKAKEKRLFKSPFKIFASDISQEAVRESQKNANAARVQTLITFAVKEAAKIDYRGGLVVGNPPFGDRLGDIESASTIVSEFTRHLKHSGSAGTLALVLEMGDLPKAVGFKPRKKAALDNGDMKLGFFVYDLFSGSLKDKKIKSAE